MPKVYCYTFPERLEKTTRILTAFARGCGGELVHDGVIREDGIAVVWGQVWDSARIMKECAEKGIDFFQIDNGYFLAARGRHEGYFRVTKNGQVQNTIIDRPDDRFCKLGIRIKPYKKDGTNIALCVPGLNFGRFAGIDLERWTDETQAVIRLNTKKKLYIRDKMKNPPLDEYLEGVNAFAVVTHSSNAAVEALIEGYAVFCDKECAAAPAANLDLTQLDNPVYFDRFKWAYSLAYAQFTMEEMEGGIAWNVIKRDL